MPEKRKGPVALIEVAIEPRLEAGRKTLDRALAEMADDDPSFGFYTDWESGQTIIKGVSELQLDRKIDVLRRVYSVDADVGAPQVAHRERLGRALQVDHTHKKQTGDTGQFARVVIQFVPGEPDSGFVFENKILGGAIPKEFVPGIARGLEAARQMGLVAGFPVTDFAAILTDGAFHDVDSSELAFEIAARGAFKELRERGAPRLVEPIMRVEVMVPDEYLGDVIGDLNNRLGTIGSSDQRDSRQVVTAFVPLANMFGYAGILQAMTGGAGEFTMEYDRYDIVPRFDPEPPGTFPPAIGMRA